MSAGTVVLVLVLLAWLLLELHTGRPDGRVVSTHPYRRLMLFIMPKRNESLVYFDSPVDATTLHAYLEQAGPRFGARLTHALVAAGAIALAENPRMNRFVAGRRLYERHGRWLTFSMKRKKLDPGAKLSEAKLEMLDGETFEQLCRRIEAKVATERSSRVTRDDREYELFNRLPRPGLQLMHRVLRLADHFGLLPGSFIEGDGMYTSIYIANLGSLGMGAAYHHLYEWGTCPLFMMVGAIEERPVVVDGKVVVRPILPIRYTYDERIEDGLNARFGIDAVKRVLEHPFEELGCVAEDGKDAVPLGRSAAA